MILEGLFTKQKYPKLLELVLASFANELTSGVASLHELTPVLTSSATVLEQLAITDRAAQT